MASWCLCTWFLMAAATPGIAQDLSVGQRPRVTTIYGKTVSGQVIALNDDSLTIEQKNPDGPPTQSVIPQRNIDRVEISRQPGHKLHGAGIGLLLGAIAGGVAGYAGGEDCPDQPLSARESEPCLPTASSGGRCTAQTFA